MFEQNILRIFCQLILAALFGSLIGLERRQIGKAAGMRTFALSAWAPHYSQFCLIRGWLALLKLTGRELRHRLLLVLVLLALG